MADAFDWDNLDEENPLKTVRAHVKQLEKELDELRKFKTDTTTEVRTRTATEAFKALKLSEKQADLFLRLNPEGEVTAEAVRAFATEYGFTPQEASSEEGEETKTDEGTAFKPVSTSEGTPAAGKMLNAIEWFELYQTNPGEAMALANRGKVKLQAELPKERNWNPTPMKE